MNTTLPTAEPQAPASGETHPHAHSARGSSAKLFAKSLLLPDDSPRSPARDSNYEPSVRRSMTLDERIELMSDPHYNELASIPVAATLVRIGKKTLRKALREIGGTTRKGSTGAWVWSLNGHSMTDSSAHSNDAIVEGSFKSVCQVDRLDRLDHLDRVEMRPKRHAL